MAQCLLCWTLTRLRVSQDIPKHRQVIGDFANYLTFIYIIND